MKRILAILPVTITLVASTALTAVVAPTAAHADDCIRVDMAVQLNQYPLMPDLAKRFNDSDSAQVDDRCIRGVGQPEVVRCRHELLEEGWPNPTQNGPKPVVWSPASNSWRLILNHRLTDKGRPEMAPEGTPEMVSPLVIAMPKEMAVALGWPGTPIGYSDILALTTIREALGAVNDQGWGTFKLGKTNPNFSTSGLSSLIAEYSRFTGKERGLTLEDVDDPAVHDKATQVESAVVHYGDTTLTFLNNMYVADQRDGRALGAYASAIAVEEQSVINYNNGNPDGKLDPGEQPRKPNHPLVAIYPKEGSSSPTTRSSSWTRSG